MTNALRTPADPNRPVRLAPATRFNYLKADGPRSAGGGSPAPERDISFSACHLWRRSLDSNNRPVMSYNGRLYPAALLYFTDTYGVLTTDGTPWYRVRLKALCPNPLMCVNPYHHVITDKRERSRRNSPDYHRELSAYYARRYPLLQQRLKDFSAGTSTANPDATSEAMRRAAEKAAQHNRLARTTTTTTTTNGL